MSRDFTRGVAIDIAPPRPHVAPVTQANDSDERPKPARSGPVHFQPLEQELAPVASYFTGHVLNAGCGNRDLGRWLSRQGADRLTNYDIASDIPGAAIGPLEDMPFADASFDAVLCNAVLEHVASAGVVMTEIARVLRPGGHAIVSVPFLQPYHACPADVARYTAEGLAALGEAAGLTTVAVNPVHAPAQTIGWILWQIAIEKGRVWQTLTWPLIFIWTRLSLKTDRRVVLNANTYQAVFVRR